MLLDSRNMDTVQTKTNITPQQQAWIDFCATAGTIITPEGEVKKLSGEALAKELGVARGTMYNWQKIIPDFWGLVSERRNEIYAGSRMTLIYKAMFAKAIKGDVAAANLIMKQGGVLKADRTEQKIEVHSIDSALE